jgi:hypothetical protein
MRRVLFQAKLVDNGTEFATLSAALKAYSETFVQGACSAHVATKVHSKAYEAMGVEDPYLELKVKADEVAEKYISGIEKMVSESQNPLRMAIKVAAVGNIMDFGSGIAIDDPEEFNEIFYDLLDQGIDIGEAEEQALILAKSILYVFDNCGESQLDKILIRLLKSQGKKVVGVVRGEPILNDITAKDAKRIGLDKELDLMISTGMFAIGVDMSSAPEYLKFAIEETDLIVAKGMANYESLSSENIGKPVLYILRTKCMPVAESIGVDIGKNVIRLFNQ